MPYLFATLVLFVLGTTLVVTTQVDAAGWFHRGRDHDRGLDRILERTEFGVDWMLHRVDATDEQSAAIQKIVAASVTDFYALREAHSGTRERVALLLTAETLDAAAIEAFRQEQIAAVATFSAEFTEMVTAVASELTLEQRRELLAQLRHHDH
jgi:Spy/CpxP family protein refolding chaperone